MNDNSNKLINGSNGGEPVEEIVAPPSEVVAPEDMMAQKSSKQELSKIEKT